MAPRRQLFCFQDSAVRCVHTEMTSPCPYFVPTIISQLITLTWVGIAILVLILWQQRRWIRFERVANVLIQRMPPGAVSFRKLAAIAGWGANDGDLDNEGVLELSMEALSAEMDRNPKALDEMLGRMEAGNAQGFNVGVSGVVR